MSLVEVKKCEFNVAHTNKTVCSVCKHEAMGILKTCPECGSTLVNYYYNVPKYTILEDLDEVFVNKDHVVKAVKLDGYDEDYYLISLTNGGTLVVDDSDFNSLK